MVPYEKEAGHVLAADAEAVRARLVHRGVRVPPRVEQHGRVEDRARGADLVFHGVLVALVGLPGLSVEDLPPFRPGRLSALLDEIGGPAAAARRRVRQ
ncbi:hypothetical protein GCM10009566_74250 [Streptomyces murinus]|uniref:Uncharacterized protein n=1 Tax=Streptomyces murinus TaxID=33900 RepID=A0A7W3RIJ8_STRMR|nr:hypothetical protein [Streptomyces murinus]MBA9051001.1 hypothetical protein [Streptomyces murinus]